MNPAQMAQQIKAELQTVTWPVSGGEVVFGVRGVVICPEDPTDEQIPPGFPWALVVPQSGNPDESNPSRIEQDFQIVVGANVKGDPMGEHAIIGGALASQVSSQGRGSEECAERARFAVQSLTGADGALVLVTGLSAPGTAMLADKGFLGLSRFDVRARCTSQPHYDAPQNLRHVTSSGSWTWDGTHCSDRYDFLQYRLYRKAGTSPSSEPGDGDLLYSGATAAFVGPLQSGNTYTVFADYDDRGGLVVRNSSSPVVGSWRAV